MEGDQASMGFPKVNERKDYMERVTNPIKPATRPATMPQPMPQVGVDLEVVVDPDLGILDDAIAYIESHGWCRGAYFRPAYKDRHAGPACLIGALRTPGTSRTTEELYPLRARINKAIRATNRNPEALDRLDEPGGIEFWNDKWCRSKEQAIRVLRRAKAMTSAMKPDH
jgi:hypothetical protein